MTLEKVPEHEKRKPFVQFIKFGLVGMSNTAVFFLLYAGILLLLAKLGLRWKQDYIPANIIAFTVSIFWSFYWNNKYVFRKPDRGERNIRKALGKCFLSYGFTGYILENILSCIWIDGLGFPKLIAPFLNLAFTVPVNFFLNKLWAFQDRKPDAGDY